MKTHILLLVTAIFVTGCATHRKVPAHTPAFHTTPASTEVRKGVVVVQETTSKVRQNQEASKTLAQRAKELATNIKENGTQANSKEAAEQAKVIEQLNLTIQTGVEQITQLQLQVDSLSKEVVGYEAQVQAQTTQYNKLELDHAQLLTERDQLVDDLKSVRAELFKTKAALLWQKTKTWLISGGIIFIVIILVVLAFSYRIISFAAKSQV